MPSHADPRFENNHYVESSVDIDHTIGFRDISDAEYCARLTLIAKPSEQRAQAIPAADDRKPHARSEATASVKQSKTGANKDPLNIDACARRGFDTTLPEAAPNKNVVKNENIPVWRSEEERRAALDALSNAPPHLSAQVHPNNTVKNEDIPLWCSL